MDRTDVLERLEPVTNTQVRNVDHDDRTRIEVTPDMVTIRPNRGARTLEMTDGAVQSMATFLGLPITLAAKLRPETFGAVSTELLGQKRQYALVLKDNAVTQVTKRGHFNALNPERVLKQIENAIPNVEWHRVLILDDLAASIEMLGENRQPVRSGDLMRAGAQVTFSPIGTVNPMVQSYAMRLICTNGMTSNTILREFHFGGSGGDGGGGTNEGDNIWQWFRRSVKDAYDSLAPIVTRYREMLDEHVEPGDRASALTAMLRAAKITGKDAEAVRALALANPPENSYDMVNLITFASSHIIESPVRARQAQIASAAYANEETHRQICPVCHASR